MGKTIEIPDRIAEALARQAKALGVSEAQLILEAFGDILAMDSEDPCLSLTKRRTFRSGATAEAA